MTDADSDENWLVSEPVVTEWYDGQVRQLKYLGFSSPSNWRSHLTLNFGLAVSESKREALFWFRLPIRVKSRTTTRPTKFYVYFIVEPDMFDVDGEDQGLSFSQQPNVPSSVQLAFKGSNICQSDSELIRLRFNLKTPSVVVMPKAEESPFEPSAINQQVLLALKSLSEATKFSAYVPQSSLSTSRLQTLCRMIQHGHLQPRPREIHTLYHGKSGEMNAWGNFVLSSGQEEAAGQTKESFFTRESVSFAEGPSESSEKQAAAAEVQEQAVVESVEKDDRPKHFYLNENRVEERQGSIPPTYQEAGPPSPPAANAATASPLLRTAKSFSIPPAGDVLKIVRQSSAPPACQRHSEERPALFVPPKPLPELEPPSAVPEGQVAAEDTGQTAPRSSKRSKPPSDDEVGEDDDLETTTSTRDNKPQKPLLKSKTTIKVRRPSKQVRFDDAAGTTASSSRRRRSHPPTTPSSSSSSSSHPPIPTLPPPSTTSLPSFSLTALSTSLPKPQSALLRQTIDWFKWAWTTPTHRASQTQSQQQQRQRQQTRRRHPPIISATAPLTHPHLCALGTAARAGDTDAWLATRARCSARVLWECDDVDPARGDDAADAAGEDENEDENEEDEEGEEDEREDGEEGEASLLLLGELEAFLLWVGRVAPRAEMALTGELRELGRLARRGEGAWLEHGMAVCAGFVVFWFGDGEEGAGAGAA
ncbi:uncharacterized protein BKCO1_960004 [Diplodia corticola]|uniref:Uncharacterized protein n=1 Tax=Diplodia corticola TaxID=236234 RepID=A0A1J9RN68_9PEZI|nr:uncharacterized protein BKCO1_960004 [Diplodia corticola]OJD29045.1 hypothetical protein BKCO1_960004 [Diplodia corticola]